MSYVVVIAVGIGSEALLPPTLRAHAGDRTYSIYHVGGPVSCQEYRDLDGTLLVGTYQFPTLEAAKLFVDTDHRQRMASHRHFENWSRI
jgi:hypothetical protein